ncbi:polyketide synthase dehydratase domain-containing protein [Motilimonas eburnea]|uniref:polyketide synthase dehydratase domain-containing protein n=1 Tax=Motilimonas eburnea TaxID=1737488 RepID=UPI001E439201|nr:polyketide synthase dehydratase domain-containing protein [Motilimonas eburnea]MCE2570357.1 polyketide synthase dehydratase domain-containing protein [Motilimonas eburnea]
MNYWYFEPFLSNLSRLGDDMSCQWQLSPEQQYYLRDHIFSGQCLVPAAISAELMSQVAIMALALKPTDAIGVELVDFNIRRPLAFDPSADLTVFADAKLVAPLAKTDLLGDNSHELKVELKRNYYDDKGKCLRQGVLVASARVKVSLTQVKAKPSHGPDCSPNWDHYHFSQAEYYQLFNPTHGRLFQSLTGRFALAPDNLSLISEFNLQTTEADYADALPSEEFAFALGPLALDSVLQACVLCCVQIESQSSEHFFSKLPVGLSQVQRYQPWRKNENYRTLVQSLSVDDTTQTLRAWVLDETQQLVAYIDKIKLHRAPNEQRVACHVHDHYRHHRCEQAPFAKVLEALC